MWQYLLEQRREIEKVRHELEEAAVTDIHGTECYRISVKLDAMIEEYMKMSKEVLQLSDQN